MSDSAKKTPSFSRREIAGLAAASAALAATPAMADQPRMEKGLALTKMAIEELKKGKNNKGGHRIKAIDLLKRAAHQIEEGIKHAD